MDGADTEHVERLAGDERRRGPVPRVPSIDQVHAGRRRRWPRHPAKTSVRLRVLLVIRIRAAPRPDDQLRPDRDLHRPQQRRVCEREDRGVGANAECQRQDGGDREGRALRQQACGQCRDLEAMLRMGSPGRRRAAQSGRSSGERGPRPLAEQAPQPVAQTIQHVEPLAGSAAAVRTNWQHVLAALPAERGGTAPEQKRREPHGAGASHARTFFARAASISTDTRAVSACSTRAPSRVIR